MGEYTEKVKYTHDDFIKKTEHQTIIRKSDEGNIRAYHGSGGGRENPHSTKHQDDRWYDRNR